MYSVVGLGEWGLNVGWGGVDRERWIVRGRGVGRGSVDGMWVWDVVLLFRFIRTLFIYIYWVIALSFN